MPATGLLLCMGLFSIFLVGSGTGSCFGAAKASCCFVRQQLRQRADDPVRLDGGVGGQAVAMRIHPDRIDAKALRRFDFPFEIVADHPGLGGGYTQRLHGMPVGALVRLAETMLAL